MEKDRRGRKKSKLTGGQGIAELRGGKLKDIREMINITQEKMAEILSLRVDQLSKMERAVKGRGINDKNFVEMIVKLRGNEKLKLPTETFNRLEEYLDKIPLPKPKICKKIIYHMPPVPYDFVGREEEIKTLLMNLFSGADPTVINITGINGIGKKYLAIEVASRCREASECLLEPCFDAIFQCIQKNKVPEEININNNEAIFSNLDQLLQCIIRYLNPEGLNESVKGKQLEILCKELLSQVRTLLVIDSFGGGVDKEVKQFLESIPAPCKVLIIDRCYCFQYQTEIMLKAFTPEESIEIIKNICYVKELKLDNNEERLIADVSGGIPLVIKFIIENISQSKLTLINILDFIYNNCYPLLCHIFQKIYDRLTSKSKILLSTFEILPTGLTGEFLCRCNDIDISNDARDALYPLVEYGLVKAVGNPISDLISQTYSTSSLLMVFITSQEVGYDKVELHEKIIDVILNKITIYASINLDFKDSSKLQQYIDENEELLSFVIDNLWKAPRFKEVIDLVPNIKLPKAHFSKIAEKLNTPYLNNSPKTRKWVNVLPTADKTSDEQ